MKTEEKIEEIEGMYSDSKSFLTNFINNVFELMIANILFCLCSIPLITAGPAAVALASVCLKAHKCIKISPVKDFFKEFKKYFFPGLYISLIILPLYGAAAVFSCLYYKAGMNVRFLISVMAFFVAASVLQYFTTLLISTDLDIFKILKNSFLLSFLGGWRSILSFACTAAAVIISVWKFKIMMALFFLILFSLIAYIKTYLGLYVVNKYVFSAYYAEKK
jgi:uncharacterized membrane protein YesL